MSDDPENKEMVNCKELPSSAQDFSSKSIQKCVNTEDISENKRYNSDESINHSPSLNNEENEENRELERMIHQSFIRRSTDFDGTSTPMLPEEVSKRRPSSARSRESFFIPRIFKKETIKNKEEKKSDNSNISKERINDTSNETKIKGDESYPDTVKHKKYFDYLENNFYLKYFTDI